MSRKLASLMAVATIAFGLVACESMPSMPSMGKSALDKRADELRTALAGEPVNVTKQDGSVILTSSADSIYPSGGWQIRPDAPILNKMVPTLAKLQHTKIVVAGYTDNTPVGPQLQSAGIANNLELSNKRAATIVTYLASKGVNPSLMSAQGFGETHPVASNDTPEGRAKNRRVELTLTGDGT